jgi:hypothetical protein
MREGYFGPDFHMEMKLKQFRAENEFVVVYQQKHENTGTYLDGRFLCLSATPSKSSFGIHELFAMDFRAPAKFHSIGLRSRRALCRRSEYSIVSGLGPNISRYRV